MPNLGPRRTWIVSWRIVSGLTNSLNSIDIGVFRETPSRSSRSMSTTYRSLAPTSGSEPPPSPPPPPLQPEARETRRSPAIAEAPRAEFLPKSCMLHSLRGRRPAGGLAHSGPPRGGLSHSSHFSPSRSKAKCLGPDEPDRHPGSRPKCPVSDLRAQLPFQRHCPWADKDGHKHMLDNELE